MKTILQLTMAVAIELTSNSGSSEINNLTRSPNRGNLYCIRG